MTLLQISEPGQSPEPHQNKLAIGIDLGTTNSLVATVKRREPMTIPDQNGSTLLPSAVHYGPDGTICVGEEVKKHAALDSANTILSVKRFIGRGYASVSEDDETPYALTSSLDGSVAFETASGKVTPTDVSAEILKTLALRASAQLGGEIDGAVITVPAYFDDAQRQATKDAATQAGLKVLRLLNEPTAAAVAYGLDLGLDLDLNHGQDHDSETDRTIAVYDLGGGTFDISILRLHRGVFEVLSTGGDSALGGDDFDKAVFDWVVAESGVTPTSGRELRELMSLSCSIKEQLSTESAVAVRWKAWEGKIDSEQLSAFLHPLINKTVRSCKRALRDAELEADDIDSVVMVGGSTRVPAVREAISKFFQQQVMTDIDPDSVVALGAARQADVLIGNSSGEDMLLLDVLPLSLGIETMGGLTEKIIHRNTTIPVSKAQEFTTFKDGQSAMKITVVQGERELVKDNRPLAEFTLRGIPPMVAGAAKILVTFQVDADGLLNVSALETSTGAKADIQVKPSFGLGDEQVTQMLRDSYERAQDDMEARKLREHQVDATRLADALEAAITEDGDTLLNAEEFQVLTDSLNVLRKMAESGTPKEIACEVEHVSKLSEAFAARRMDASIKKALSGHTIDEFED